MRLPARAGRALDREFCVKYALRQEEVEIRKPSAPDGDDSLNAYLVREEPREGGSYSAGHGVMLLPDAAGWRHPRTRLLADRLAVFCSCLVLIPDLQRGLAGWSGPATGGGEFETWLSGLPPKRIASDLRECTVYMRADLRVRKMGLVGVGLGGGQALHEASQDAALLAATAVAICPIKFNHDAVAPKVPLLCVFDGDSAGAAEEVRTQLRKEREASAAAITVETIEASSPASGEACGAAGAAAASAKVPSASALTKLKLAELKARLGELGLPMAGLKRELVARLVKRPYLSLCKKINRPHTHRHYIYTYIYKHYIYIYTYTFCLSVYIYIYIYIYIYTHIHIYTPT